MNDPIDRRRLIGGMALGASGLILSGCDSLNANPDFRDILKGAEGLHRRAQRMVAPGLAREYDRADMSPVFRTNGNRRPASPEWAALAANNFEDWRLIVDGLVARPLRLSLRDMGSLPQRAQITRHDCVEGWSAIGKWQGPQLAAILRAAGLSSRARFIVFHCADDSGGRPYYESIDLDDAFHPQTIMAVLMNDHRLPVGHGAPTRLRVERQLGYKHAKFVMRIEARDSLDNLYGGKGGYWEDVGDYAWYAGI
ncbi:molybdopterin-dependent oxidoreductase [Sphingomonas sp. LY160]|uniref:molybdopterin-dependent oxidoreductase n=1 Tax=Sphingomonas sp. LY160 TaxID=3095342 RepID=UPI002ADED1C0|nr:molybdopterin-dependent oxidoreductase [Sphingomonas sp. LY160]MEA1072865.1 molybdopterin-dependent oxidoreductase [Sphingomonas sp. LY160]